MLQDLLHFHIRLSWKIVRYIENEKNVVNMQKQNNNCDTNSILLEAHTQYYDRASRTIH